MTLTDDIQRLLDDTATGIVGEKAQRELEALLGAHEARVLQAVEPDLIRIIERFHRKRQRDLTTLLQMRLRPAQSSRPQPATHESPADAISVNAFDVAQQGWRAALHELSEHHIFQWNTYYRAELDPIFESALELCRSRAAHALTHGRLSAELDTHAHEIFSKGYAYTRTFQDHDDAIAKSLSGLQKFLAIPVELYSRATYSVTTAAEARALRLSCSAMLHGILLGYGRTQFEDRSGWQLLPLFPRSWANFLAFLRGTDAEALQGWIEEGAFARGLAQNVTPVLAAVDRLMDTAEGETFCMPRMGQFSWEARRVEISLSFPRTVEQKRYLEIQCFLDSGFVRRVGLDEAVSRGISLIIADLRPDVRQWAQAHDVLRTTLVDTGGKATSASLTTLAALDILRFELNKQLGIDSRDEPISTNLARNFPLESPEIASYFHVYRSSIRRLVQTFEDDTGVRLWCSVRRSGKTTACLDLGVSGGNTMLVNQTMDHIGARPGADIFYRAYRNAVDDRKNLPDDFFAQIVQRCVTDPRRLEAGRYIFILDEYESLFDDLRLLAAEDQRARYRLVQPLLNQMVAFSRQNLLVFLGQRPDSHYIIMDQNQLSPYVQQDAFPLFEKASDGSPSEFDELLRRVLTERVTFDASFSDAVYAETSGHPYLTVNLLVDFFQWMIDERRHFRDLDLDGSDFQRFSHERLTPEALRRSPNFELFLVQYIPYTLGEQVRRQQPWLYAVFTVMKRIALKFSSLSCSESDFAAISKDILDDFQWDAEYLLRSASMSNFLSRRNGRVRPAIPLLARLAAVSKPRLV